MCRLWDPRTRKKRGFENETTSSVSTTWLSTVHALCAVHRSVDIYSCFWHPVLSRTETIGTCMCCFPKEKEKETENRRKCVSKVVMSSRRSTARSIRGSVGCWMWIWKETKNWGKNYLAEKAGFTYQQEWCRNSGKCLERRAIYIELALHLLCGVTCECVSVWRSCALKWTDERRQRKVQDDRKRETSQEFLNWESISLATKTFSERKSFSLQFLLLPFLSVQNWLLWCFDSSCIEVFDCPLHKCPHISRRGKLNCFLGNTAQVIHWNDTNNDKWWLVLLQWHQNKSAGHVENVLNLSPAVILTRTLMWESHC